MRRVPMFLRQLGRRRQTVAVCPACRKPILANDVSEVVLGKLHHARCANYVERHT